MNTQQENLEIILNHNYPSPCEYDDKDDFIEAFVDFGKKCCGKLDAASISMVEKYAREDWDNYQTCGR